MFSLRVPHPSFPRVGIFPTPVILLALSLEGSADAVMGAQSKDPSSSVYSRLLRFSSPSFNSEFSMNSVSSLHNLCVNHSVPQFAITSSTTTDCPPPNPYANFAA